MGQIHKSLVLANIRKDKGFGQMTQEPSIVSKKRKNNKKQRKQQGSITRKTTKVEKNTFVEKNNQVEASSVKAGNKSIIIDAPPLNAVETSIHVNAKPIKEKIESEDEFDVNLSFGATIEEVSSPKFNIEIKDLDLGESETDDLKVQDQKSSSNFHKEVPSAITDYKEAKLVQDDTKVNRPLIYPSSRRSFAFAFDSYEKLKVKPRIYDASTTTKSLVLVSPERSLQPSQPSSGGISLTSLPLIGAALLKIAVTEYPGHAQQARKKVSSIFKQTTQERVRLTRALLCRSGSSNLLHPYNVLPGTEEYKVEGPPFNPPNYQSNKWLRIQSWLKKHKVLLILLLAVFLACWRLGLIAKVIGFCYSKLFRSKSDFEINFKKVNETLCERIRLEAKIECDLLKDLVETHKTALEKAWQEKRDIRPFSDIIIDLTSRLPTVCDYYKIDAQLTNCLKHSSTLAEFFNNLKAEPILWDLVPKIIKTFATNTSLLTKEQWLEVIQAP